MLDDSDPTDNTNVIGITNTTIKNLLDKMKFDHKRREALTNAGVAGITPVHVFWDRSKKPYGSGLGVYDNIQGEIDCELLDPRNVFFMNPSQKDAQKQPRIIKSLNSLPRKPLPQKTGMVKISQALFFLPILVE
jgi:hypothetical protein